MKRVADQRLLDARRIRQSLNKLKIDYDLKLISVKDLLLNEKDEEITKHYKGDVKMLEASIKETEAKIQKQKEAINAGKASILTFEQFLVK